MRAPCHRQCYAIRHERKNIRLMRHHDDQSAITHLGQGSIEIVDAFAIDLAAPPEPLMVLRPRPVRPLVAEAHKPERLPILLQAHRIVFVHGNTGALQLQCRCYGTGPSTLHGYILPRVVIAQHRKPARAASCANSHAQPSCGTNPDIFAMRWVATKSPGSSTTSGASALVRATIWRIRSSGIQGRQAFKPAITAARNLSSFAASRHSASRSSAKARPRRGSHAPFSTPSVR